jgi:hypothetical protein
LLPISSALAGSVTIALIVVLGIFVYPWLLKRRYGGAAVAATTLLLAALFVAFQHASSDAADDVGWWAGLAALVPLIAGLIVARIQRGASR